MSEVERSDMKKKRIQKGVMTGFIILVLISAWLFIVKYGIDMSKNYMDEALTRIEMRSLENHQALVEENVSLNIEIKDLNTDIESLRSEVGSLNEDIQLFSLEVNSLKSSIDTIDTSVTNSVEIQAEIGTRIQELENRLQELKNSLNILLEAPNE